MESNDLEINEYEKLFIVTQQAYMFAIGLNNLGVDYPDILTPELLHEVITSLKKIGSNELSYPNFTLEDVKKCLNRIGQPYSYNDEPWKYRVPIYSWDASKINDLKKATKLEDLKSECFRVQNLLLPRHKV